MMRLIHPCKLAPALVLWLALPWLGGGSAAADSLEAAPSPVSYQHIARHNPNFSIHVVTIDLGDPRVSARVARGGPDPDGDGPWTTTLLPVSEIAAREGFDIAINGDFFIAKSTHDIEGPKTGYVRGLFASPEGMAMTDGQLWHRGTNGHPYLGITTNHLARLFESGRTEPIAAGLCEIVAGGPMLVQDGKPLEYRSAFATNRHPRTAAGLNRAGSRLLLIVVDGRQPKLSIGMTLYELSQEMMRLGCASAINLDGGGSTALVYRDPATHALKVLNSPSDTRERPVADALGITVRAPLPAPKD
jgi:hypothetical protein